MKGLCIVVVSVLADTSARSCSSRSLSASSLASKLVVSSRLKKDILPVASIIRFEAIAIWSRARSGSTPAGA